MKKFSGSSHNNIKIRKKDDITENSFDIIKMKLHNLIDDTLRIMFYGSARRNIQPTATISGQDMLVDSIIDLFTKDAKEKEIKLLESLKHKIQDWKTLDQYISNIKEDINIIDISVELKDEIYSAKKFINSIEKNIDDFDFFCENYIEKLKTKNTIEKKLKVYDILLEKKYHEKIVKKIYTKLNEKYNRLI